MGYIDPKLYPEWFPESSLTIWIRILVPIAIFLIIPYIYVKFVEPRLVRNYIETQGIPEEKEGYAQMKLFEFEQS